MAIESIALAGTGPSPKTAGTAPAASPAGPAFADQLASLVSNVEATSAQANQAVGQMLNKTGDVHDAMIALQRAEMSLQLTVAIRNKLVQAYQDIMRMPV